MTIDLTRNPFTNAFLSYAGMRIETVQPGDVIEFPDGTRHMVTEDKMLVDKWHGRIKDPDRR